MARQKRRDLPRDLVRARDRFVEWRKTRQRRTRVPESLWAMAAKLVATHGLHRVASTLKVNYYALKKRAAGELHRAEATGATFIELPAAVPNSKECVIEVEEPGGPSVRVSLKGYEASDIAIVGTSLRTPQ